MQILGRLRFNGQLYLGHPLELRDVEAIASIAEDKLRLNSVVQWLEAALQIAQETKNTSKIAAMQKKVIDAKKTHDAFIVKNGFLHVHQSKNQSNTINIAFTNHELFHPNVLSKAELVQVQSHLKTLRHYEALVQPFKNLSPSAVDPDPKLILSGITDDNLPFFLPYFLEQKIIQLCQGNKVHQSISISWTIIPKINHNKKIFFLF